MKRPAIFLRVVPLMIGIFLLTRGSIPCGTNVARVGAYRDGILDRSFFVISMPKAKMIQPKTYDVSAPPRKRR